MPPSDDVSPGQVLVALLAVCGVLAASAVALRLLLRARYDARVYINPGSVRVAGRLSPGRAAALRAFFRDDFPPARRRHVVLIRRRAGGRAFEVRFVPPAPPGDAQRVRNFLAAHLA